MASAIFVTLCIIGAITRVTLRIVGAIIRVTLRIIGSIIWRAQLVVDGNHILHEEKRHHHAFEDHTHDDGAEKYEQETVTAHPVRVAEVVGVRVEQHEKTGDDHEGSIEYIQPLVDLFDNERPEVENVMHDASDMIQLRPLFLGYDEDESRDDRHNGQHSGNRRKCFC